MDRLAYDWMLSLSEVTTYRHASLTQRDSVDALSRPAQFQTNKQGLGLSLDDRAATGLLGSIQSNCSRESQCQNQASIKSLQQQSQDHK